MQPPTPSSKIPCYATEFRRPFRQYRPALMARWGPGRSGDSDCSVRWADSGCSVRLGDSDCRDRLADSLAALYDHWDFLASSERRVCRDYCSLEGSAR